MCVRCTFVHLEFGGVEKSQLLRLISGMNLYKWLPFYGH